MQGGRAFALLAQTACFRVASVTAALPGRAVNALVSRAILAAHCSGTLNRVSVMLEISP
jgi:hypothetical protein